MTKKGDKDDLADKMEKLAETLADDLKGNGEPPKARIDGFKALTTYFTATRKLNLKNPDDDEEGTTFNGIRQKLNAPAN